MTAFLKSLKNQKIQCKLTTYSHIYQGQIQEFGKGEADSSPSFPFSPLPLFPSLSIALPPFPLPSLSLPSLALPVPLPFPSPLEVGPLKSRGSGGAL